jgi:hemoglobin/transferrin/lactoferrin receptor protein
MLAPPILLPGVRAADAPPVELEQIVVTATRLPMRAFDVPALVYARSAETVQMLYQSRTLPDALGEVTGVMVQKTASGQGSPFIRGFTGFRNVLLVDGIRLNNSAFREGPNQYWNTVDPYSLQSVEVLKGTAAVPYGSDAIGGVVNVITDIADAGNAGFAPRLLYRYADAESSQTGRAEALYRSDALRARGGVTYRDYDDVEAGGGTGVQPRTGYGERNADARLEYDLDERTTFIAGYQFVDQDDAWRTHRTIYGIRWNGTQAGTDRALVFDQRRQLGYLQLRHDGLGALADTVRASVSYQEQNEDQYRLRSNLRFDELGFDVRTLGLWVQFEKRTGRTQWLYGADYYGDDVSSYNVEYDANGTYRRVHAQGPVADDARYDLSGLFGQAIVTLTPRVTATVSARYTEAAVDANKVEDPVTFAVSSLEDDWDNFSGSARLGFMPVADGPWLLYAGVAQAFRAPNLSDLTRLDVARSGELETPSPGLDPETYLSWEAGFKLLSGRWSVQAAYFDTRGEDVVIRAPTGRTIDGQVEVTKVNAGESNVRGVEAEASFSPVPQVALFAGGMLIDGEGDAYPAGAAAQPVTEPLDVLMPTMWRLGARWTGADEHWRLEALVEHADEQDELSTRDKQDVQRIPPGGTPGYTVVSLRSEWRAAPQLTLSLAIDNLFNQDYRVHGSGLNEPGRNLIASVALQL